MNAENKRGGGRAARRAARAARTGNEAIRAGIPGGRYQPLSDADMQAIHRAALRILERTGLGDSTEELNALMLPKGAVLNEIGRLCFPAALVEDVLTQTIMDGLCLPPRPT